MTIGTRQRQLNTQSASLNNSRRNDTTLRQDEGGLVYEAATIAGVNSTNSFDDSAGGLPVFEAGQLIDVRGFADNSRQYRVVSSDANSVVVDGATVTDEAEGEAIIIRSA